MHEELTELQRLRAMVELITAQTDLAPVGSTIINADGAVISNPLFSGLQYPDKLEAYYHVHSGPKGALALRFCIVFFSYKPGVGHLRQLQVALPLKMCVDVGPLFMTSSGKRLSVAVFYSWVTPFIIMAQTRPGVDSTTAMG